MKNINISIIILACHQIKFTVLAQNAPQHFTLDPW
jgi:hypothetical protein